MAKKKLGQGMDLLFMDSVEESGKGAQTLRISSIEPNRDQPRTKFDEASIVTLADSIRQHGVLQPLLVRPAENGMYQIVAGERRWRAARMAGVAEVPVVIRELSDKETAQIALVENLQREDLDPIEEAMGYKGLIEDFGMTQNEVAETVGISRSSVTNSLRLLELDGEVRELLRSGEMTVGHAKVILGIEDKEKQKQLAKETVQKGLTVRETEQLVRQAKEEASGSAPKVKIKGKEYFERPAFYGELEIALKEAIGQKVEIKMGKNGSSQMKITFSSEEELAGFAKRFSDK